MKFPYIEQGDGGFAKAVEAAAEAEAPRAEPPKETGRRIRPRRKNPVGGTHIGLQKDVGRKNGAGGLPKILATAYPTGPRAATAESLPGVQVGP